MTVSWPHLLICGFHPNTKPFLWGASCVNYTPAIAEISSYVSILPCQAFVGAGDGGSCRACLERLRYMTFASCAHGCEKCLAQLACQVRWCELSDPFGGKAGSLWAELLQLIISRWIYRNEQKSPKDLQNDVNMLEIIYLNKYPNLTKNWYVRTKRPASRKWILPHSDLQVGAVNCSNRSDSQEAR